MKYNADPIGFARLLNLFFDALITELILQMRFEMELYVVVHSLKCPNMNENVL